MKILFKFFVFISLLCLSQDESQALTLDSILHSSSQKQLYQSLEREQQLAFFKQLCEKQKKKGQVPLSCYKIEKDVSHIDSWCLQLSVSQLKIQMLKRALKSNFLSLSCRNHLKSRLRIIIYRKKDLLIPELKNYWTNKTNFF